MTRGGFTPTLFVENRSCDEHGKARRDGGLNLVGVQSDSASPLKSPSVLTGSVCNFIIRSSRRGAALLGQHELVTASLYA